MNAARFHSSATIRGWLYIFRIHRSWRWSAAYRREKDTHHRDYYADGGVHEWNEPALNVYLGPFQLLVFR